jgi:hypothetical protein
MTAVQRRPKVHKVHAPTRARRNPETRQTQRSYARARAGVGGQMAARWRRRNFPIFAVTPLISLLKGAPEQVGSAKRWTRRVIAEVKPQKQAVGQSFGADPL